MLDHNWESRKVTRCGQYLQRQADSIEIENVSFKGLFEQFQCVDFIENLTLLTVNSSSST